MIILRAVEMEKVGCTYGALQLAARRSENPGLRLHEFAGEAQLSRFSKALLILPAPHSFVHAPDRTGRLIIVLQFAMSVTRGRIDSSGTA
jgi:hypothetical protein